MSVIMTDLGPFGDGEGLKCLKCSWEKGLKDWIENGAKTYDDDPKNRDDIALEAKIFKDIGKSPAHLTTDILKNIEEWKWGRKRGLVKNNKDQFIIDVTEISLKTENKRLRLEILTLLKGVHIRMASAILYFCFPTKQTIMDRYAWNALKYFGELNTDIKDDFEHWESYNGKCLEIAKKYGVSLRDLDKALWQYGKEKSKKAPKEERSMV